MSECKEYLFEEIVSSMQLGTNALGNENNPGVPLLKMGNLTIGGFNFEKLEKLKEENREMLAPFILKRGDFLFNTRNTLELVGKSSVWNNQLPIATFNSNIMRIKFKGYVDDFYLGFYFSNNEGWNEFKRIATGTTSVAAIYTRDLLRCKVYLPNYKAQRQIANILSTCDAVIEKTQAAIAKYKAIKQGMLHDLFTRGIDIKTGKLRPKYEEAPELYKESKLEWIPKEWDAEELSKYLSFISYGFTNPMPETNEGPYLITAANVNGGRIQYETCRKTSQDAFDNLLTDKSRPKINDILLTKDGTLGRIAIVENENLCINQSVAVLRPNNLIVPHFLKILLESPSYQKTMLDEAGGSTIKHIYITVVDKMLIGVPKTIDEQKEIAARLNVINNKLQTEQSYLYKLQQIKAGLMNDLLSGKKTVEVKEKKEVVSA